MKKITLQKFDKMIDNKSVYEIIEIIAKRKKRILSFNYRISFYSEYWWIYWLELFIWDEELQLFEYSQDWIMDLKGCYWVIVHILFLRDALSDYKLSYEKN